MPNAAAVANAGGSIILRKCSAWHAAVASDRALSTRPLRLVELICCSWSSNVYIYYRQLVVPRQGQRQILQLFNVGRRSLAAFTSVSVNDVITASTHEVEHLTHFRCRLPTG